MREFKNDAEVEAFYTNLYRVKHKDDIDKMFLNYSEREKEIFIQQQISSRNTIEKLKAYEALREETIKLHKL